MLINLAGELSDEEALGYAIQLLDELIDSAPVSSSWISHARYNRANAKENLLESVGRRVWEEAEEDERRAEYYKFRALRRLDLRAARRDFLAAAQDVDPVHRTQARTNLGNILSTSGRWLEAFEQYVEAVALDPTNGNAAGNAALSLYRVLQSDLGPAGHLAAVYSKYRAIAHANRARTVELAGEEAAAKWDALPEIESHGHLAHAHSDDPYLQWVARERLALTPVMDGLGSDNPRFDDVSIHSVFSRRDEEGMPQVFAAANVLKSDYLAARRTVYQGLATLDEGGGGWALHPRDTGTYADTLDYAVYGEPISFLTLGARAALDVLDKIAVATNEYLGTSDNPGSVNFRKYWFDKKTRDVDWPGLHCKLTDQNLDMSRILALAELADDLEDGGLYEDAQAMRNRSTHRLVRGKLFDAEGITNTALTTLDIENLKGASVESLRVARAGILYFHALVSVRELRNGSQSDGFMLPVFDLD
ncbi:LA2681 family HEPN domain-containing protein [Modestobacter sp. VKM Ac-2978]|uniref:LA2681 family HEPN domain-containing protein n=1 Tax=Modestobacter sp. VKM Ac-2978 TaxID=3004132 RepID=UPI0022AA65A9|nr:LA2681 family HEPN domain-containing protein [Modestobacter sp. VKM Ac-2978]MCZ2850196.1 LA2681 family HEPN domain-containing protein [Modestobacter sp. VKM Ac-2978]